MAAYWYIDGANAKQGPVEDDVLRSLIASGQLAPSAFVWAAGMANWMPASDVPELRPAAGTMPPPLPVAGAAGPLQSGVQTWELFWRSLLMIAGFALVIPAPWTATGFWRYIARTTALPGRGTFSFAGKPEDIWYVFAGQGLLIWLGESHYSLGILANLLSVALSFATVWWFCSRLQLPGSDRPFAFMGSFWGYLGWTILILLSIVTVIGWAWAYAAFLRWLCRNVSGEAEFQFIGSGWDILWRTVVAIVGFAFVIPIPWVAKWLVQWFVSQIETRPAAGAMYLPGRSL